MRKIKEILAKEDFEEKVRLLKTIRSFKTTRKELSEPLDLKIL